MTDSPNAIHANATKDFFVHMITRDISLGDCIFDLLDNAIDGARRTPNPPPMVLAGYRISVSFDATHFTIGDDCGGISLDDAIHHAFNFGRRASSPQDVKGGIGLYGIGMKRAIFKIGGHCEILSHASDASFKVIVDVPTWLKDDDDWDFYYEDTPRSGSRGTQIVVTSLHESVARSFSDPAFKNSLIRDIARDYSFFIENGLKITICGQEVPSYSYKLLHSEQLSPAYDAYQDQEVTVRIIAGLVEKLPDEVPDELRPEMVDRFGWFVVCNDRVVLAGDKTNRTVWGDDSFNVWHNQYNGFAGFLFFSSDDQRKLPWTTTKRELDRSSPLYRRAVARMKIVTKSFIDYTQRRKLDIDQAHQIEAPSQLVELKSIQTVQPLRLPTLPGLSVAHGLTVVSYKKKKAEIEEIKRHLGDISLSNKDVGIMTFDYFRHVELGK